jgi:imidazole glycerol-phosphate synthase subunit HisH
LSERPVIAVLDYGIGNLRSAQKALERMGADARLTADAEEIRTADGVVLPGVGHFGRCMQALRATGLDALAVEAAGSGRPFFGICIGMQLLFEGSEEAPGVAGLGVLPGTVRLLPEGVKRPQMQWNLVEGDRPLAMFAGIALPCWMYFVHSFAALPGDAGDGLSVATCDYGGPLVAAVERGELWATQFHPEKSGRVGLDLVGNFVERVRASSAADPSALAGT